jgi:hypothetical protein
MNEDDHILSMFEILNKYQLAMSVRDIHWERESKKIKI